MEYFVIYLLVMADRIVSTADSLTVFILLSLISLVALGVVNALHSKQVGELENLESNADSSRSYGHDNDVKALKGSIALLKAGQSYLKPVMWISTLIWFVSIFITATFPNTKQLATIIGTGVAYNAVSSEPAKEMAKEAYEIIQLHMRNYTQELRAGLKDELSSKIKEVVPTEMTILDESIK